MRPVRVYGDDLPHDGVLVEVEDDATMDKIKEETLRVLKEVHPCPTTT